MKELVMYSRTRPCPWVRLAREALAHWDVPYREILIDQDATAQARLLHWTGFLSVPTLVVAAPGSDLPVTPPAPLPRGHSPMGVNRGSMLTEPTEAELHAWLRQNGFLG
jgi:glutaredoxin